jgi:hypothetical protein
MDARSIIAFLVIAIAFWIGYALYLFSQQNSSNTFNQRFARLGNFVDRTPSEIRDIVVIWSSYGPLPNQSLQLTGPVCRLSLGGSSTRRPGN